MNLKCTTQILSVDSIATAPPQGWVEPTGRQSLGLAEWDALVARGVQFKPYDGPRIVVRTFGDCLSPLFNGGQEYFEVRELPPDESLIDGGLYLVEPENQEEIRQIVKERLGRWIPGVVSIAKILRFFGGEWILVNREGLDYLRMGTVTHEVVGFIPLTGPRAGFSSTPMTHGAAPFAAGLAGAVATAAMLLTGCADGEAPHCNRQPFAADSPECNQVGLNAATTTSTASLSAGSVGSFTTPNVQGSITVGPFGFDTTVILTVTGQWAFTFSGGTFQNMSIRYGISTVSTISFTGALITVDQSTSSTASVPGTGPLSQEISVPLLANTTTTYNVLAGQNPSGILGTAINITGIIKAEVIKR